MAKFERVERFKDDNSINLPTRKTMYSAGYDFEAAEDIIIEPFHDKLARYLNTYDLPLDPESLEETARSIKIIDGKLDLIPTGIKAKMNPDECLILSIRSSSPLKYWLTLANGIGLIDADYYGNPSNDGEIFFQVINLGVTPVKIHKGDVIGQGTFQKYITTEDDCASGERVGGFGSTTR